jgi:MYXO-CTERM domain-containing protein
MTEAPAEPQTAAVGQIHGVVLDAYLETPIPHAEVGLREGGARVTADAEGRFVIADVVAGTHRVHASADGFLPGALANVEVVSGAVVEVTVRLFQVDPPRELQERWLDRPARPDEPTQGEPEGAVVPPRDDGVGATRAALEDPLPETIRVWRSQGTPLAPSAANGWADQSCAGNVQVFPLEEYVKGVIPHEWVPSWHPEALRAGAIAARSYASSHALGGGRWDCADVDDGTVTQVYRDDRAGPTDMAVDATAGMVVVRDERVVRTEYSAENSHPTAGHDIDDPVCAGTTLHGHGRGACQWGTQRWATAVCANPPCTFGVHGSDPKDHVWMMEHYFPGTTVSTGMPPEPCAILGPDGGILDDDGPCFAAYGPPEYWRTESVGHDGGLHWTNAFESDAPSNWAKWSIALAEAGEYRVEVHIVDAFAEWGAARYEVRHDATESEVVVDQGAAGDGWLDLGTFPFAAGDDQHISLFDNYDVSVPADQHLVADAIRLVPFSAVVDDAGIPPVDDAGAMPDANDGGLVPDAHTGDGDVSSGCGCTTASPEPTSVGFLALALALFLSRRRVFRS